MEGICGNFLDTVQFSNSSRDVTMSTNFVAKLPTHPALIAVAFRHGMGYRYFNVHVNSVNYAAISRKNVVNCGPVTSEKTRLICKLFVRHGKSCIFSRISQDILD